MPHQILAFISSRVDLHREVFGIHYFPYGVLIAIGFLAGSVVLSRYARRHGVTPEVVWDIATWVLIGALIGTRLVWVFGNWSQLSSPAEALMVWHGGILGGLLAGLPKVRRHKLPIWPMLDAAAPALALGLILGRAALGLQVCRRQPPWHTAAHRRGRPPGRPLRPAERHRPVLRADLVPARTAGGGLGRGAVHPVVRGRSRGPRLPADRPDTGVRADRHAARLPGVGWSGSQRRLAWTGCGRLRHTVV